jgi:hypothetical protein
MRDAAAFGIRTQPKTLRGFSASAIRRAADDGLGELVDAEDDWR